jgi:glycerol-3-phosphate dehydrogenase (NAD(P)+)
MKHIAIMGAGSWGTALSIMAGRGGHRVMLWSRNAGTVEEINRRRINTRYLESVTIPACVEATDEVGVALKGADMVVLALPSHAMRNLLSEILPFCRPETLLVSATKGIETQSGKRMSEVAQEVLGRSEPRFVCLSGPSFAREVVAGQPTAVVAAGRSAADNALVQEYLSVQNLRIYTNSDLVGTEIGGAVKNIIAIAAGMVSGLGMGSNSVAALVTRGLAEITRLAVAEGARIETLMGLAGLGDLVLTCTGALSRNRRVGEELGKGRLLNDILSGMSQTAEGVKTTVSVRQLASRRGIEMPITGEVYSVLHDGKTAADAAEALMTRPLRKEF